MSIKRCAYKDCRRVLPGDGRCGPGISLSRLDSKTAICSDCGVREALYPRLLNTEFAGSGPPAKRQSASRVRPA